MKKLILLLSVIAGFGPLNAQEDVLIPGQDPYRGEIIKLLDSLHHYIWTQPLDIWDNSDLDLFYYDNNTKLVKLLRKDWDENRSRYEWFNEYQILYTHEGGLLRQELKQNWELGTSTWIDYSRYSYLYDDLGNRTEWLWERWDDNSDTWINFRLTLFDYIGDTNLSTLTTKVWEPTLSDWINAQEIRYYCDEFGNDTLTLTLVWNMDSLFWENLNKKMTVYNTASLPLLIHNQNWDPEIHQWISYRQSIFTYDPEGHLTESLSQDWDAVNHLWMNKSKIVYTIDQQGLTVNYIEYKWDSFLGDWINRAGGYFEYDMEGDKTNSVTQIWNDDEEWLNTYRSRYVYLKVIGVPELDPSPVKCTVRSMGYGSLCLECEGLQSNKAYFLNIYNLQGGESFSGVLRGSQLTPFGNGLTSGIYLLTLSDDEKLLFRKKVLISR